MDCVVKWLGIRPHRTQASQAAVADGGREDEARSDYGNAQRLVRRHGKDLLYVHGRGWFVWNGTRWVSDDSGEVVRRAKDTVKAMVAEAADLGDHERILLLRHALASEAAARINAMISLAESEAAVSMTPGQLDADPLLLNVMNGTIDLRTGDLRPHRREDLITKLAPVQYDPDATLPEWDAFLVTATAGDPALMAYLQRGVGYCLTGDTSEEKFFFVHGPGATGKTTFAEATKAMMGDYAMTADFETFLARSNPNGANNDIARLQGARLVTASEVEDGRQFAHGLLKQMTGRDKVTARFLFREYFEFVPQCKILLVANHAPRVRASDAAMWRRMARVPFERVLPPAERDPGLKGVLCDPARGGPAVLAWAVKGCMAWRASGLGSCAAVDKATAGYRSQMDTLQRFIDDCCVIDPRKTVAVGVLHEEYAKWCEDVGGELPLRKTDFGQQLRMRDLDSRKGAGGVRLWQGIGLREPIAQVA